MADITRRQLTDEELDESLALFEQSEDDEYRASLMECMGALDEYDADEPNDYEDDDDEEYTVL